MTDASTPTNESLDPILEQFDQAMLAWHLSQQGQIDREQLEQATLARDWFTLVLADLDALRVANPMLIQDDVWQLWHKETQKNLIMVAENLKHFQP